MARSAGLRADRTRGLRRAGRRRRPRCRAPAGGPQRRRRGRTRRERAGREPGPEEGERQRRRAGAGQGRRRGYRADGRAAGHLVRGHNDRGHFLARADRLRDLGVARVQDRTTGQDGSADTYDIVVDPVAGPDLGRYIERLRPNGRYVLVGAAGGAPAPDAFGSILTTYHNSPTLLALSLNSVDADTAGAAAAELFGQAARGDLRAIIDEQIPLTDAWRAHERLESSPVFGKITLRP
ncbi:zinc-binding dehydrogenase [Streptomyces sp. NPDC021212]|uniref:zinc-binding dehydrogenase n=1 Tax=Streptomyces sp. NPDC021212 TaxID=3365118 RepID=UPI0037BD5E0D